MPKEIVLFDIDGTLADAEKVIPESTKAAVRQLQENDIYVAIATGRPPFLFQDICKELDIASFVSFSGQYVVFEGEVIYENPIAEAEILRLYELSAANRYPMIFMSNQEMKATVGGHPHVKAGLSKLRFAYPEVDDRFFEDTTIYQALLFCETDQELPIRCEQGRSRFIRWNDVACDVLPGGGSKAVGIEKLLDAAGIQQAHSYAFGDGPNDVEMIETAGFGVAMGNAVPAVKAVADYVTDDVDHDGVAKGLRHLGLL